MCHMSFYNLQLLSGRLKVNALFTNLYAFSFLFEQNRGSYIGCQNGAVNITEEL